MALKAVIDRIPQVMVIADAGNKLLGNKLLSCAIYDLKSGSIISSFTGGHSTPKGLSFIADDYLISACNDKPYVKVWTLSENHPEECKMHCPGIVTALAASKCGTYCIAGIGTSIYLWEVCTGNLLNILQYHSQSVTCLRFTSDGSYFISGGKDGIVLVWIVPEVVPSESFGNGKPHFAWMNHSSEVTDIFVGNLGIFARVVTVSLDMTCRIYEMESGNLLTTICVDYPITAVTMDESEYFLYLGCNQGPIYRINLFPVKDGTVQHIRADPQKYAFIGHKKTITCLSLSLMGRYLLSGSEDHFARVWDTKSFSCIKQIPFDGVVTNAFIAIRPPALLNEKYHPRVKVSKFKNQYSQDDQDLCFLSRTESRKVTLMHTVCPDNFFDQRILTSSPESLESLNKTKVSQKDLALINTQLYSYALSETFSRRSKVQSDSE